MQGTVLNNLWIPGSRAKSARPGMTKSQERAPAMTSSHKIFRSFSR